MSRLNNYDEFSQELTRIQCDIGTLIEKAPRMLEDGEGGANLPHIVIGLLTMANKNLEVAGDAVYHQIEQEAKATDAEIVSGQPTKEQLEEWADRR